MSDSQPIEGIDDKPLTGESTIEPTNGADGVTAGSEETPESSKKPDGADPAKTISPTPNEKPPEPSPIEPTASAKNLMPLLLVLLSLGVILYLRGQRLAPEQALKSMVNPNSKIVPPSSIMRGPAKP